MSRATTILFTLTCSLLPLPVGAVDLQRYSGILVAVDESRGALRLEETGPWTGKLKSTVTEKELLLAPDLEVKLIKRDPDGTGDDGWRGGFAATPLGISALRTGDYITVGTHRRGDDAIVELIEVVRPELDLGEPRKKEGEKGRATPR
jgi:hypothetical protein